MGAFRPGAGQPPRRKESTPETEEVRKIANRDQQGLFPPESPQRQGFSAEKVCASRAFQPVLSI